MPPSVSPPARRAALGAALLTLACDSSAPLGPSPVETLAGRIVFTRGAGTSTPAVYSMRPDGTDEQPVATLMIGAASPDWRRQAFVGATGPTGSPCLVVLGTDGVERPSPVCGADIRHFTWSPDGSRLAARVNDSIYVVRFAGERPVLAGALDGAGSSAIAWAPDGRRFATAVSDRANPTQSPFLVTVSADGRPLRTLANVALGTPIAWSPDGAWIVARSGGATNANALRLYGPDVVLAGRELVPATEVPWNWKFAFSPDGSRLALIGNRAGTVQVPSTAFQSSDVLVVRIADGALTRVTPTSGTYTGVVWSAGGDRLAYSGTPGGWQQPQRMGDVFVVDLPVGSSTASPPTALTNTPDVDETVTAWF